MNEHVVMRMELFRIKRLQFMRFVMVLCVSGWRVRRVVVHPNTGVIANDDHIQAGM